MTEATRVLDEAVARAPEPRLEARAQVEREFVRLETETSAGTERARRVADAVLPVLERERDEHGQSRVWCLRALVAWSAGLVGRADEAWCRAAECARRSGDERELFDIVMRRASAAVFGPTPVDEAIRRCDEIRELVRGGPVALAATMHALASLHAMSGAFEHARGLLREANEMQRKLGDVGSSVSHHEALVELLAGQPALAEERLRGDLEKLERIGDGGMLATTTAMLAQAVYAQGRRDEAERLCRATERSAATDDIVTQVVWRGVRAKALADAGRHEDASQLARAAVALVEATDLLTHHGDAMIDLGHVLRAGGHTREAQRAVRSGLALYERKGNLAGVARARSMLIR
jgi:tetratricopeptide (TPR) repeat protein